MKLGTIEISKIYLGSTEVASAYLGTASVYSSGPVVTPDYFYFENTSNTNGNIGFSKIGTPTSKTIEYSTNKVNWTSATVTENLLIPINSNDKVYFRTTYGLADDDSNAWYFKTTVLTSCNIGGNIMSMNWGSSFTGNETTFNINVGGGYFQNMFRDITTLESAFDLYLPAMTLQPYCYSNLFNGCTSLTNVPDLYAPTLVSNCYRSMLKGTGIYSAPYIAATTLAEYCCYQMFRGCTNLTQAPELPATTLADSCYREMFQGCTSLSYAPELLASTLATDCYRSMFYNCSNLSYIKCLATDISATDCTKLWVRGVSNTGTFVKDASMTSWTTGTDGTPSIWAVEDYVEPMPVPQPIDDYFYFDNIGSSPVTVTLGVYGNPNNYPSGVMKTDLEYSTDTSGWTDGFVGSYDEGTGLYTHFQFTVPAYSKIYVRSNGHFYDEDESGNYLNERFFIDGEVNIGGNPLSLIFGQDYSYNQSNMPNFAFCSVFSETPIVDASELYLPDYTTSNCYSGMFCYCESLVTAPLLPATTLSYYCYSGMFEGCTALENVYCLAETDDGTGTNAWLSMASSTGRILVSQNTCLESDTSSGIPLDWTVQYA